MSKPAAFIMVEGGRTWFRTTAETEEAIRTGFIMETVPLYTAPPKRTPLGLEIMDVCGSEDYREGFKDGVLYAEKCHDIGGGNE